MQVNSRPSSHLPYLLWTMANALVEAGVARRSGNRRRAILAGNQARGRRVLQLGELPAEEAANLTVLCMGYRARTPLGPYCVTQIDVEGSLES